jgi:DNA-directed RNA polymerase subunit RPC12/RpoP
MSSTDFFPKIGTIAVEADALNEDETQNEGEKPIQEIESLCMKCGEQGITRMMLTTIPFFSQVIVMSFKCEHCGASNNEVQSAGEIRRGFSSHSSQQTPIHTMSFSAGQFIHYSRSQQEGSFKAACQVF